MNKARRRAVQELNPHFPILGCDMPDADSTKNYWVATVGIYFLERTEAGCGNFFVSLHRKNS
jgi:hypothetical protein